MFDIGETVYAAWTNCGHKYTARAKIFRENRKSWWVELLEDVRGPDDWRSPEFNAHYPKGNLIKIPKVDTRGWSKNNRLIHPSEYIE
jgi:hypothetical protein